MEITTNFDSGSIEVIEAAEPHNIRLQLKADNNSCDRQWFHFRLVSIANEPHQIKIINAARSTFSAGWEGYQAVASYDQQTWFRVPTEYDGQQLTIQHTPEYDSISYAYFTPYTYARHRQVISSAIESSPASQPGSRDVPANV